VAAAQADLSQLEQDEAQEGDPTILDQAAVDRIAQLPSVRVAVPVIAVPVVVVPDQAKRDGTPLEAFDDAAVGVDITLVPSLPVTVLAGRLPAPGSTTEVTVDETYLQRLGLARSDAATILDTRLSIGTTRPVRSVDGLDAVTRWTRATIVGVVSQDAGTGQILAAQELVAAARQWVVAQVRGDGVSPDEIDVAEASPFAGVFVVADSVQDVGRVRASVAAIGYSTSAPENIIDSVNQYLHVVEIVLTSVGVIALAVAALGIANASLAAVRERRREIGVLKAVGATDRDIRRIFLVESGSLGLIGGALGAVLGYAAAVIVAALVNRYLAEQGYGTVPVEVPVVTMLAVTVGATVLAVVAGILPAAKAARLPARDAMGSV
jgi:putative ABC transport system permease protein